MLIEMLIEALVLNCNLADGALVTILF